MNNAEQITEIPKNWVSISEAASYLRISKDTLRRWEKQGLLKAYRSPTNHRYYNKHELDYAFSKKPDIIKEESPKPEAVKQSRNEGSKVLTFTAFLLGVYIVLMVFLAFLLLNR